MAKRKAAVAALPVWLVGMLADLKDAGKYVDGMEADPAAVRAAHEQLLAATPESKPANEPAKPSEFRIRFEAAMQRARDKLAKQKAEFGEPAKLEPLPETLLDSTELDGKTLKAWQKAYDKMCDVPRGTVIDVALPAKVMRALMTWAARGYPTQKTLLVEEYREMQAKIAEKRKDIDAAKEDAETVAPSKIAKKLALAKQREERLAEMEAEAAALYAKIKETT